jgi:hypothetical protein
MNPAAQHPAPNRRRRVRHKIRTAAFARISDESAGKNLDLNRILDISEDGLALQCVSVLTAEQTFDLHLELSDTSAPFKTTGRVIWSDPSGRCGFRFSDLPPASLLDLQERLFLNARTDVANSQVGRKNTSLGPLASLPSYVDTLSAIDTLEQEVRSAGPDLSAALELIATCAQNLTHASGAAIALAAEDPNFMVCRASAGRSAPPIGSQVQIGSGFSGDCVRAGKLLGCDDSENDDRIDREICRALGVRSLLAAPVNADQRVVGILEVFSAHPFSFTNNDIRTLRRLADSVLIALNRGAHGDSILPALAKVPSFRPLSGGLIEKLSERLSLPNRSEASRSYLSLASCAVVAVVILLGYYAAPRVRSIFQGRVDRTQAVRTSSHGPILPSVLRSSTETGSLPAAQDEASAENALGLLYEKDADKNADDAKESARWFTKAAEHGSVAAQSKLGSLYWNGSAGVPQDLTQAYFWIVLARAGGDAASKSIAPVVAARLNSEQTHAIESRAEVWLEQHRARSRSNSETTR